MAPWFSLGGKKAEEQIKGTALQAEMRLTPGEDGSGFGGLPCRSVQEGIHLGWQVGSEARPSPDGVQGYFLETGIFCYEA